MRLVVTVAFGLLLSACGRPTTPTVESPTLSAADCEILRVTIASVVLPRFVGSSSPRRESVTLLPHTVSTPLDDDQPPASIQIHPSLPLVPPPRSRERRFSPLSVAQGLLIAEELPAWIAANRLSRRIPELAIAGVFTGRGGIEPLRRIAISAPSHSSDRVAVLYAMFVCGETCGEGLLVRLRREDERWIAWRVQQLWIA
jgi:hypothetical protein